ncbi:MAG: Translation initiation factor IF-3 [Candidatus Woesebacteria bacterium GW2011_GWA1_44_23]|uniref:Translation initiation factor IF-3 n=1 Tax=Candidatus Woesebacteria bacterium GW2011_GWA1_44_23 TaxID=1618558 RepID=A0A837ICR1_9BACT|nr:MAG: Translation initiation factor IF-3 [Candidatus Woesebacteria bacterium GW2011_GWA1_44_23]
MGKTNTFWRTDYQIRASSLRVIGADGKLIGVLSKNDAIEKAKKLDLTLVEIAPNAVPPVAKIVDFGKFKYAEEKKLRAQAKNVKGGEVKEIRFSPFIADNDFKVRVERIKEFFADKNKVRVVVVFTGPQMRVKQTGYKVIQRILVEFGDTAAIDMEPKFLGKHLITVISPISKKSAKIQAVAKKE